MKVTLESNMVETLTPVLEPCPFCGGTDLFVADSNELDVDFTDKQYAVCCDYLKGGCGAVGGFRMTKEEAVAVWNQRSR